jgi:hypothetical protein
MNRSNIWTIAIGWIATLALLFIAGVPCRAADTSDEEPEFHMSSRRVVAMSLDKFIDVYGAVVQPDSVGSDGPCNNVVRGAMEYYATCRRIQTNLRTRHWPHRERLAWRRFERAMDTWRSRYYDWWTSLGLSYEYAWDNSLIDEEEALRVAERRMVSHSVTTTTSHARLLHELRYIYNKYG